MAEKLPQGPMTTKDMIDHLLKKDQIHPNQHIALQLSLAGDKIKAKESAIEEYKEKLKGKVYMDRSLDRNDQELFCKIINSL